MKVNPIAAAVVSAFAFASAEAAVVEVSIPDKNTSWAAALGERTVNEGDELAITVATSTLS